MNTDERKAAARAFKERVPVRGVFALRCTVAGRVWVGPSRDLTAEENRLRFLLRSGGHRDKPLQALYAQHGGDAFTFEVLDRLDADLAPMLVSDALKASVAARAAELGAGVILP
ncbi:MAG: GIY-YIG nuclease family protein [Vicinamibacterales bacterium]